MAKGRETLSVSKPRSGIPPAGLLSLFNPACIFIFFFQLIPPALFSTSLLVTQPRAAGETLSWDLQKSLCNFPFDNRVKLSSARSLERS